MKLALNLSYEKLTDDYFRFSKEIGCDGLICHLNTYNATWGGESDELTTMSVHNPVWSYDSISSLKKRIESFGLELYGIENLNPFDWYDVLLAGPERDEQIEYLKLIVRNLGKAGVRYLGYNFSLSGVYGRRKVRAARGGAETMVFDASDPIVDMPIPDGMVWNTEIEKDGFAVPVIPNEELWERLRYFLERIVPVAEECGVVLAAHPDDPPVERLRGNARLVNTPSGFHRLVDMLPSPSNRTELCIGTLQEMPGCTDLEGEVASLADKGAIGYVHLRNVRGKLPHYTETLIDDGDIDVPAIIRTLSDHGFDGPIVPDHTPYLDCREPWLSGMAFQIGYLRACLDTIR